MPPLIVTENAYEFVPPHEGGIWPRLLSRFSMRLLKSKYRIHDVEVRGHEQLSALLKNGDGLLLAPNHCRMSDALVLQALSRKLRQPFFVMASSHLFRGSPLLKWALRRIGAFSVYREGVDRAAIDTATDILSNGKRPLVIFPEGALSHANERLNALMEGVSFIARTAARKVSRSTEDQAGRRVFVVPVAIRYLFQGDLLNTVNPMLQDIERRLSWRPHNHLALVERVYKLGNALLGLKEIEYLGDPQSGTFAERLQRLIDTLLNPLEEEWLNGRTDPSVINRVKELRKAIVPDMIHDEGNSEPLSAEELDRRWQQLEDMSLAQSLSLFPKEYIASRPSTDRILETVERMAKALSGEEQANGPMKAIIQIGEPLPVSAKRDRSATGDPILAHIESELMSMLNKLGEQSTMHESPSEVAE